MGMSPLRMDRVGTKKKKDGKISSEMCGFLRQLVLKQVMEVDIGMFKAPEEDIQMYIPEEEYVEVNLHCRICQFASNRVEYEVNQKKRRRNGMPFKTGLCRSAEAVL